MRLEPTDRPLDFADRRERSAVRVRAARASIDRVLERPVSITILVMGLGYAEYVLTGVAALVHVPFATGGSFVGTLVSATVTGTLYAVLVTVVSQR